MVAVVAGGCPSPSMLSIIMSYREKQRGSTEPWRADLFEVFHTLKPFRHLTVIAVM